MLKIFKRLWKDVRGEESGFTASPAAKALCAGALCTAIGTTAAVAKNQSAADTTNTRNTNTAMEKVTAPNSGVTAAKADDSQTVFK